MDWRDWWIIPVVILALPVIFVLSVIKCIQDARSGTWIRGSQFNPYSEDLRVQDRDTQT